MGFYQYLAAIDVHAVDCSGRVDLQLGVARLKALESELATRPVLGGHRKLIIDFRNTIWESEEVHMQLSAITRRDFGLSSSNPSLRVAFVNNRWSGAISESECWFVSEAEAMHWLLRPSE